jgi:ssRNA-specific RNase YbeY (16S rRNA maturation enzyme)
MLGEVYLCPSYIKVNGESLEYLAIHGLLHLMGFNHEKNRDRIRMKSTEQKIQKWLKNRF